MGDEVGLRPEGRSFRHGRFVLALRDMAKAESGVRIVETTAKELLRCEDGRSVIGVKCSSQAAGEQSVRTSIPLAIYLTKAQ